MPGPSERLLKYAWNQYGPGWLFNGPQEYQTAGKSIVNMPSPDSPAALPEAPQSILNVPQPGYPRSDAGMNFSGETGQGYGRTMDPGLPPGVQGEADQFSGVQGTPSAQASSPLAKALDNMKPQTGLGQQIAFVPGYGNMRGDALPNGDTFIPGHGAATSGFFPNRLTPNDLTNLANLQGSAVQAGWTSPAVAGQTVAGLHDIYNQQQGEATRMLGAQAHMKEAQAKAGQTGEADKALVKQLILTDMANGRLSPGQEGKQFKYYEDVLSRMNPGGGNTQASPLATGGNTLSPEGSMPPTQINSIVADIAKRSRTGGSTQKVSALVDALLANENTLNQNPANLPEILNNVGEAFGGREELQRMLHEEMVRSALVGGLGRIGPEGGASTYTITPESMGQFGPGNLLPARLGLAGNLAQGHRLTGPTGTQFFQGYGPMMGGLFTTRAAQNEAQQKASRLAGLINVLSGVK